MTRSLRRTTLLASLPALMAILLGACGDEGAIALGPPPVALVTVTAPTTEIREGQTVQFTATALDADGNVLEGRTFDWTSGIGTVASVSSTGLVTGNNKGQSTIRATTDGVTGSLVITVSVAPPAQ